MLLLSSADLKHSFQEHYKRVKQCESRSELSVLILVQTVCKVYQQKTEVAARKEINGNPANPFHCVCASSEGFY